MNRLLLILMAFLTSVFFATSSLADGKDNKLSTVTFATNLHCDKCKKKIEANIPFEKGVKDLHVDVKAKTITITYRNDKTSTMRLQEAIQKLGYTCLIKEESNPQPSN